MNATMDKTTLERKTRQYWKEYDHNNPKPHLEWYVKNLLPVEMNHVSLPDKSYEILVLLVGFSIEPLLQAVYAYKPRKVILIVSQRYGQQPGKNWGNMVKDLIKKLPKPPKEVEVEDPVVVQANPQEVFRALLREVRQTKGVVIDITGAKKNMVAGAFLYAAIADVPVSYVDFADDAYDPKWGKPYGYGAQIGTLDNPYAKFALRDWERVRDLYRRYKFKDARQLLVGESSTENNTILATMKEYLPDSVHAIRTLEKILYCYELWDAGLYNEAAEQAAKVKKEIKEFQPPTAVERLNGKWFRTEEARFKGGWSHLEMADLQAYVYDELERIKRLLTFNRDYRSVFLRAGSLNEVVMTIRMIALCDDDKQQQVLAKIEEKGIPWAEWLFDQFVAGDLFKWHGIEFPLAQPITPWWEKLDDNLFNGPEGWREFIHRRNELAHQYYSPPPKWAEDALRFVQANVEDFWGSDAGKIIDTQALPWSEVCQLTGLAEHLSPNLLNDGQEKE